MKYIKIGIFLSTIGAIAGGDIAPYYEPYVKPPYVEDCSSGCKQDGVYIDKDAGLMWQDSYYDDGSDGAYKNDKSACKSGNLSFAKNYCESSGLGGYSDWRLPTSDEMMDISMQNGVFKDNRGADFWTSTPAENNKYYVVYTADGYRYARDPRQSNYIRCVRCLPKK
ncbi:MAG: DUF1566 domain-containing protein [Sulfurovaceae bacterium]|nr:DUF1566 domain-containing protein [Sulfurovaceae bacterium]